MSLETDRRKKENESEAIKDRIRKRSPHATVANDATPQERDRLRQLESEILDIQQKIDYQKHSKAKRRWI